MTRVAEQTSEMVVAIIPPSNVDETALTKSVSAIEFDAQALLVESDDDYREAADLSRKVKNAAAEITDFFKPLKDDAHKLHKSICSREKALLAPLTNAEATLKRSMGAYVLRKENERRAAEEAARRLAQEEAERKLAEAVRQEAAGDAEKAQSAMLDAQAADSMSRMMQVMAPAPTAQGVSASKDWEIVNLDSAVVPVSFGGMELRPVDVKAVMRMIRASKGSIRIPGVTYRETAKISVRK